MRKKRSLMKNWHQVRKMRFFDFFELHSVSIPGESSTSSSSILTTGEDVTGAGVSTKDFEDFNEKSFAIRTVGTSLQFGWRRVKVE